MNEIQGMARLKIHDGKLEEFKRVASQCMQVVRTNDTGTLQYEFYFNEDQTERLVLERYRDAQSLRASFERIDNSHRWRQRWRKLPESAVSSLRAGATAPRLRLGIRIVGADDLG